MVFAIASGATKWQAERDGNPWGDGSARLTERANEQKLREEFENGNECCGSESGAGIVRDDRARRDFALTTNKGQKIDAVLSDINLLFFSDIAKMSPYEHYFIIFYERGNFMKTVNLGDKYTHRITLRLNDEQYEFLIKISSILGVSPSDYLRMTVNSGMVATKNGLDEIMKGMVGTNENVKTDSDDIV